jgi:ComF family protein
MEKVKNPKDICPVCLRSTVKGFTHLRCKNSLGLGGLTCLWSYEGVVRKAIISLKYKYARDIARELSNYASEKLKKQASLFPKDSVLVPVPLYWYKKNFRGFNQVEEVGRVLAKNLGWKFNPDLLIKRSSTPPQTELKKDERLLNLRGKFGLNRSYRLDSSLYILLDDVWTTGSTLREAAKVLKRQGAAKVWGLSLARSLYK